MPPRPDPRAERGLIPADGREGILVRHRRQRGHGLRLYRGPGMENEAGD